MVCLHDYRLITESAQQEVAAAKSELAQKNSELIAANATIADLGERQPYLNVIEENWVITIKD